MKKLVIYFIALLVLGFSQPQFSYGQITADTELRFAMNIITPPLSISKSKLDTAKTVADLTRHYKPEWIKEFIRVDIFAPQAGKMNKASNKNDLLSSEQKNLMANVDVGSEIEVKIHYIPNNNLKQNEPRIIDFRFIINPETKAAYPGGDEKLEQYMHQNAIDKIKVDNFESSLLASIKFTINKTGNVEKAIIVHSSKDDEIDTLLLKTVQDMPCWKPAQYANAVKVPQEMVLNVGNLESCLINSFNIE